MDNFIESDLEQDIHLKLRLEKLQSQNYNSHYKSAEYLMVILQQTVSSAYQEPVWTCAGEDVLK